MSFVEFCVFFAITFVQGTYGQRDVCSGPPQTAVTTYLEKEFFECSPANFAMGTHPSGVFPVLALEVQQSGGLQPSKAFVKGVAGYVFRVNCTYYYFPTTGCVIKPYILRDSDDYAPNLHGVTFRQLLKIAKELSKEFPYCLPCSFLAFRKFSGPDPAPAGQMPASSVIFDLSNFQAGYFQYPNNYNGSQQASEISSYAASQGYRKKLSISYDGKNVIISQVRYPQPKPCKRTANDRIKVCPKDAAELALLTPGSACLFASLLIDYLSTLLATTGQLLYTRFGINRKGDNAVFYAEGYVPAITYVSTYDPVLYVFCS